MSRAVEKGGSLIRGASSSLRAAEATILYGLPQWAGESEKMRILRAAEQASLRWHTRLRMGGGCYLLFAALLGSLAAREAPELAIGLVIGVSFVALATVIVAPIYLHHAAAPRVRVVDDVSGPAVVVSQGRGRTITAPINEVAVGESKRPLLGSAYWLRLGTADDDCSTTIVVRAR